MGSFFEEFTPLLGTADQIRAGRIYPGGEHLERLIGPKGEPEPGWFYPEAWVFSPAPAINPGSSRSREGQTLIYDREGRPFPWEVFVERRGATVLGGRPFELTVKLLDGSCTLPKELHFRPEDEPRLREFPRLARFSGTLIKPEVWIRHPAGADAASPSFVGFREAMDRQELKGLVESGVEAMEEAMNAVLIEPGQALYLPGGVVHSLGKGLYFEVLASGDLKVTLQDSFAGRRLSEEERYDAIYRPGEDSLAAALEFVDPSSCGPGVLERWQCVPTELAAGRRRIVKTPQFTAEWLRVAPGSAMECENDGAAVLAVANGRGRLTAGNAAVHLQTGATDWATFRRSNACYAALIHASTPRYRLANAGPEELIVLRASA